MNNEISNDRRLSYLSCELEAVYHEITLKCGVSDSAMRILYAICMRGDECSLSEIVRTSGISKQTINSSLRNLEKDGILYLKNAEGKKKTVVLTDKGKSFAEKSALKVLKTENEIFNEWTEEERKSYIELTERFICELQQKVKEF